MAALKAALEKFRSQQQFSSNVLEQGRKDREEKLQKKQAVEARRPVKSKSRARSSAASASQASDGPSVSLPSTNWKDLQPKRQLEPLGFRKKQVIDFLRAAEAPQSSQDILLGTGRDLRAEADLRSELVGQHNIHFDDSANLYTYVSAVQVKDKTALLRYIRAASDPVAVGEISDAYGAIKQDIEALCAEGQVYVLHSYDLGDDVIFPVDLRLAGFKPVQDELAELWRKEPLPEDDEAMAAELRKIGLKPAPRKAPRQRSQAQRKKKARKPSKLRHVTNVHLAHLGIFEGEAPTQID